MMLASTINFNGLLEHYKYVSITINVLDIG
jgi:hypothetical protein